MFSAKVGNELEGWWGGELQGEALFKGKILRGGGSHHLLRLYQLGYVMGLRGSWELEGGGDGAGSRRELKAELKTVSGLSYNFRKGRRKDFNGISEMSVAFYVFFLSLISRGQNEVSKALFSSAVLILSRMLLSIYCSTRAWRSRFWDPSRGAGSPFSLLPQCYLIWTMTTYYWGWLGHCSRPATALSTVEEWLVVVWWEINS